MKTFDWTIAVTHHRPEWLAWLKENHNQKIDRDEFIAQYQALRATDGRLYKAKRYTSSKVGRQYDDYVEKFGFFV